ncbi:T9SS type A sorting domain-containing protein, partial [bacterium]|nr:T9SS type A sorting domain-containing protein [bacterium]
IEVDPVDSNLVFATVDNSYNYRAENSEGVFKSTDGGKTWELVLASKPRYGSLHRYYRKNIAYDMTSISTTYNKAMRWYVAHPNNSSEGSGSFYRSEDGGETWTRLFYHTTYNKIYAVKTHPTDGKTVYMATDAGLYHSTNRGQSFSKLGDLPSTGDVMSVEINPKNPDIIFATVKDDGVYRSTNGGANFTEVRDDYVYYVFMNPGFPDLLYMVPAARTGYNLEVSRDGGDSWTESGYFEEQPGLGRTYKIVIRGQFTGIVPNPQDSTDAVSFSVAQIRKTDDAGVTFDVSSDFFTGFAWGWGNESIAFDKYNPDKFVTFNADVGMQLTETGSDYFEDRGVPTEWRQEPNKLIPWTSQYNGDIEPVQGSNKIITSAGYTFDTKVVSTTDAGQNWTLPNVVESGISTSYNEYHLFVKFHSTDPSVVYAGNKISTDGGQTFRDVTYLDNMNGSIFGMCEKYPDVIYAINRNNSRDKIYRSSNRGQSWSLYTSPGWTFTPHDSKPIFNVHPTDPNRVYAVYNGSTPGITRGDMAVFDGTSWKALGVLDLAGGISHGNFVSKITFDPSYPNIMYVSMFSPGVENVWRSIDDGETWMNISYNLPRIGGVGIEVNPHTGELFAGSAAGTWIFPPPYKSSNRIYNKNYTRKYYYEPPAAYTGKIKDQLGTEPMDNFIVRIYDSSGQQKLGEGITKDGYYFITVQTDDPNTTETEGIADNSNIIIKMIYDGTEYQLYTDSLGTQSSILHESGLTKEIDFWVKDVVLDIRDNRRIPIQFALENNYPNPFNPETTIKYSIAKTSRVTLTIYNVIGQKIKTIVDKEKQPGYYSVKWDGTNDLGQKAASGIYIYRLQADNYIAAKKMIFLK